MVVRLVQSIAEGEDMSRKMVVGVESQRMWLHKKNKENRNYKVERF
jgi:hypothetical protein